MKRLGMVVVGMLYAVAAHAAEDIIILDVMPGGRLYAAVEYVILAGRALGKFLGVL